MARFFNKNEIIIIILIILLFDLNASCFGFLNYIIYKNETSIYAIIIIMIFLLADTYIYHVILHIVPVPEVEYGPNQIRNISTCEKQINIQIEEQIHIISQLEQSCDTDRSPPGIIFSEKIVFNFIAIVLIIIVICCLTITPSNYKCIIINDLQTRTLRSIPILMFAMVYIFIGNFKLNKN